MMPPLLSKELYYRLTAAYRVPHSQLLQWSHIDKISTGVSSVIASTMIEVSIVSKIVRRNYFLLMMTRTCIYSSLIIGLKREWVLNKLTKKQNKQICKTIIGIYN